MCTRARNFERGFLEWNPCAPSLEPLLVKLRWHEQHVEYAADAAVDLESSSSEDPLS